MISFNEHSLSTINFDSKLKKRNKIKNNKRYSKTRWI